MQRHDVASTLRRRYINVMCPLGCFTALLIIKSYWHDDEMTLKDCAMKPHTVLSWIPPLASCKSKTSWSSQIHDWELANLYKVRYVYVYWQRFTKVQNWHSIKYKNFKIGQHKNLKKISDAFGMSKYFSKGTATFQHNMYMASRFCHTKP